MKWPITICTEHKHVFSLMRMTTTTTNLQDRPTLTTKHTTAYQYQMLQHRSSQFNMSHWQSVTKSHCPLLKTLTASNTKSLINNEHCNKQCTGNKYSKMYKIYINKVHYTCTDRQLIINNKLPTYVRQKCGYVAVHKELCHQVFKQLIPHTDNYVNKAYKWVKYLCHDTNSAGHLKVKQPVRQGQQIQPQPPLESCMRKARFSYQDGTPKSPIPVQWVSEQRFNVPLDTL